MGKLKVLSLFSGVAGFELGLDPEHFEVVGLSEIDEHKNAILEYRFPNIKNYGDIANGIKHTGKVDVITGGTPCTSFSVAGLKEGFNGKSGLFTYYTQQLEIFQPKYFIWENVKGCLSSTNGWDIVRVQSELFESGYDFRWQVLNAADYGIPQGRERVYIVGVRRDAERESQILREKVFKRPNIAIKNDCEATKNYIRTMHLKQNGRIHSEIAPTITKKEFPNVVQSYGGCDLVRTLTIGELEKHMGWPEDWTKWGIYQGVKKEVPVTYRKQMCGDGVISPVISALTNQLILDK